MRSCFAAAILVLAARPVAAEDALKVVLSHERDWLRVAVVNVSKQALQVNANIDGGGASAIDFEVRDGQGRLREFTSKVNGAPLKQADLPAGGRIAEKISFDSLVLFYELEAGTYEIT